MPVVRTFRSRFLSIGVAVSGVILFIVGIATVLSRPSMALRSGAQIFRYSSEGPGVFAFSRIDRDERLEYVVALNNSETSSTANVPTYSPAGVKYKLLVDTAAPNKITTGSDGSLSLTVPPLGFVIYRASARVPQSETAPGVDITHPQTGDTVELGTNTWDGQKVLDRVEVAADLDTDQYAEVTFAVREGDGDWTPIGTDDNAPYRVFYDASHLKDHDDTRLSFRAIVNDLAGHLAADQVVDVGVEFPAPAGPSTPYALIHYHRADGEYGDHTTGNFNDFWGLHLWGNAIEPTEGTDWTSPKPFLGEDEYGRFAFVRLADDTQPVNFIVHRGDTKDPVNSPDRSFDPSTTPEIWLQSGDVNIYTSQTEAQGFATVPMRARPNAWASRSMLRATARRWRAVLLPTRSMTTAVFRLSPADLSLPLTVSIRDGGSIDIDAVMFTPTEIPTAWFQPLDQTL